ncbi:MAG TPA: AMP-binding protein [Pseudonocardia sp.]|jgi:long-chain acyl-CoA synthetase|nr:AMP-binding protein [Pseudonocardia sp.]
MTSQLRELLDTGLTRAPDAVVLTGDGGSLTWAQIADRARRVASALVRDGVSPQDRVVYLGKNDVRFIPFVFGCALAGAVPTPVNWRLAGPEVAAIVTDCAASVLVVDDELTELAEAVVTQVTGRKLTVVTLGVHERWPSYDSWCGPSVAPEMRSDVDPVALQLYTSGTTGRPKGAMFGDTNLRVLFGDISREWELTESDVSLVVMPLFHMGGLAWALAGLARGARLAIVRDFVPAPVLDTMATQRVTMAFFVPTMLAALCAVPDAGERAADLRRLVYSGSPIGVTALVTAMSIFRCGFVQIYGLTEATGAFAQLSAEEHDPHGPRADLLGSSGRPYPWVTVRTVDPETGQDTAPGEVGEFWTRSEQNLLGYWRQPEQTARALTSDGWLRTGDLGRIDPNGYLFLVDRVKDMVISGGENVYPAEVEAVLATHPGITEVAVIGVPDSRWGETVKAIVVAAPGSVPDPAEVIDFARQRLARFKCPTSVDVVVTLPRTATGKVRKPELRERYWAGHERRIH